VRRLVLVLTLCAVALGAFAGSAAATSTWLAPTPLSKAGLNAEQPMVAVNEAGAAVAVWTQELGPDEEVAQAATRPPGGGWSAPVTLSSVQRVIERPRAAIDAAGNATAAWSGTQAIFITVEAASLEAGGGWGPAKPISAASHDVAVAESNGRAIVTFSHKIESETPYYTIESSQRPPGGEWSTPVRLSPENGTAEGPQVVMDAAGDALARWTFKPLVQLGGVEVSSLAPGGSTWSTPLRLNPTTTTAFGGTAAIATGGAATVTWESPGSGPETFVAVSASRPAAGATWGQPQTISPLNGYAVDPLVAVNGGGEATAIWAAVTGNTERMDGSRRPGALWSVPAEVAPTSEGFEGYGLALDEGGRALAIYGRETAAGNSVEAIEGNAAGAWTGRKPLTVGVEAEEPLLAGTPSGDAIAAWRQEENGVTRIVLDAYDSGPRLGSVAIPAAGSVGAPLAFSVAATAGWLPVAKVEWDFGDGAKAVGAGASHAFAAPGDYPVAVTATDTAGVSTVARGTVHVTAPAKVARKAPRARAGRLVPVKGKFALPTLSCPKGGAACAGVVKLTFVPKAKVKGKTRQAVSHKKPRRVLLGKSKFTVAAGKHRAVRVKLGSKGLTLLRSAPKSGLPSRLEGTGIAGRAVVLKPAPTKHRAKRSRR
jgi:hypothetical protein